MRVQVRNGCISFWVSKSASVHTCSFFPPILCRVWLEVLGFVVDACLWASSINCFSDCCKCFVFPFVKFFVVLLGSAATWWTWILSESAIIARLHDLKYWKSQSVKVHRSPDLAQPRVISVSGEKLLVSAPFAVQWTVVRFDFGVEREKIVMDFEGVIFPPVHWMFSGISYFVNLIFPGDLPSSALSSKTEHCL